MEIRNLKNSWKNFLHNEYIFNDFRFHFSAVSKLARRFNELAESCLLLLHLEIRCHCFYYLGKAIREVRNEESCYGFIIWSF